MGSEMCIRDSPSNAHGCGKDSSDLDDDFGKIIKRRQGNYGRSNGGLGGATY